MITNEKGDTIRIAEIRLRPKDLANPQNGFLCVVASKVVDSRDGEIHNDNPIQMNINLDDQVAEGVLTAEEYASVYSIIAKSYEYARLNPTPSSDGLE